MRLRPHDRRAALRRVADPAATAFLPCLAQDAWGALKAERGQPVRWSRLGPPAHLVERAPLAAQRAEPPVSLAPALRPVHRASLDDLRLAAVPLIRAAIARRLGSGPEAA